MNQNPACISQKAIYQPEMSVKGRLERWLLRRDLMQCHCNRVECSSLSWLFN
jgi:hypothetical protein